jgi:hypothetical protein
MDHGPSCGAAGIRKYGYGRYRPGPDYMNILKSEVVHYFAIAQGMLLLWFSRWSGVVIAIAR